MYSQMCTDYEYAIIKKYKNLHHIIVNNYTIEQLNESYAKHSLTNIPQLKNDAESNGCDDYDLYQLIGAIIEQHDAQEEFYEELQQAEDDAIHDSAYIEEIDEYEIEYNEGLARVREVPKKWFIVEFTCAPLDIKITSRYLAADREEAIRKFLNANYGKKYEFSQNYGLNQVLPEKRYGSLIREARGGGYSIELDYCHMLVYAHEK